TNTATGGISAGGISTYVTGPMTRSVVNGTSYMYPVGDAGGNYRPIELLNVVATGTAVMRMTLSQTGALTTDGSTMTTVDPRNWYLETVSGTFTSATIRITENSIGTTNLVGVSTAQSGNYTSVGGNFIGATITSNTGQTSPGYYAVGDQSCTVGTWYGISSTD